VYRLTFLLTCLLVTGHANARMTADVQEKAWKLELFCDKEKINMVLDLNEESVEVPGMEMFGPMNGYMNGNIYGVWTVTSCKILSGKSATVSFSNDLGSETQKVTLTQTTDSTWTAKLEGTTVVKRVENKKLVKISPILNFKLKP